ncbi:bifunctional adenosylcobinamide kinase/adenosylcobinamide-phosphate guanylyltransferase [Crenobacter sp. SG2303]|uniref:Bifunctional adenosylcobalamin biosynthesis protein n=1 Tax=Crenobacter oryzisoli TaxID=3056844 RepID=A0ABT7XUQ3_9NEIS|nr:bifunctional adenosylcobinamide kinase/adenosylcobinamide-phosphate guanylyltransferase [Crenobacter sp. SG2303]MDN0077516.1 bifunctional adenosylcobinamide kinase/adenosylcobinamide-phosphate guanylyltransferase [Crenobacter sp. SG2303]
MIDLISGGARSGKSRHAESLALAHAGPVGYVATAERRDDAEFAARIEHHRARRPSSWALYEAGQTLAETLAAAARPDGLLLVDCLGMWLMRFFGEAGFDEAAFGRERAALLASLPALPGHVVLVSNEIGWGVVAMDAETRRFVDELGRLNQDVAAIARRVTLVACGLPLVLKGQP